jgi:hypothetical protein
VLACDLVDPASAVARLHDALATLIVSRARADGIHLTDRDGRAQWLMACYRTSALVRAACAAPARGAGTSMRALIGPLDLIALPPARRNPDRSTSTRGTICAAPGHTRPSPHQPPPRTLEGDPMSDRTLPPKHWMPGPARPHTVRPRWRGPPRRAHPGPRPRRRERGSPGRRRPSAPSPPGSSPAARAVPRTMCATPSPRSPNSPVRGAKPRADAPGSTRQSERPNATTSACEGCVKPTRG